MSKARAFINSMLRPFGYCIGRIVSAGEMMSGEWVAQPLPTGWRAYRLLPLTRA